MTRDASAFPELAKAAPAARVCDRSIRAFWPNGRFRRLLVLGAVVLQRLAPVHRCDGFVALGVLAGALVASSGCSLALDFDGYRVARDAGADAESQPELGPALASFDSYHFARGRRSFSVPADEGLFANDGDGARLRAGTVETRAGGSVRLAANGSFEYTPPGTTATFWGDDVFEYTLLGEPSSSARVRLTVQPPALTVAELLSSGGAGFGVAGGAIQDFVGRDHGSLAPAGDVNGDGLEDFVIGVSGPEIGGYAAGRGAFVLFGKADSRSVSLAGAGSERAPGFAILGEGEDLQPNAFGTVTAGAGDVNGDGLDDVIVGSWRLPTAGGFGAAYVVFGKTDDAPVSSREILAGNGGGFAIVAGSGVSFVGYDVDGAGDVDGDGLDDVIVGVPARDSGGVVNAGSAFVVYGKVDPQPVDVDSIAAGSTRGFAILGSAPEEFLGVFVAGVGDVNGDGLSDVVASTDASADGRNRGRNFVVLGKTDDNLVSTAEIEASGIGGFLITGADDLDGAARVARGRDVNGDGLDDILIGAPNASFGTPFTTAADAADAGDGGDAGDAGAPADPVTPPSDPRQPLQGVVYVLFGSREPTARSLRELESEGGAGFAIGSSQQNRAFGYSLSSGDVDGDGRADVIASVAPQSGYGRAYVAFGRADTTPVVVPPQDDAAGSVLTIICPPAEIACASMASGSDVNGDGLDDLLLGSLLYPLAPQAAGGAYLAFGWDMSRELQGRETALLGRSSDDVFELGSTPIVIARGGRGTDTLRAGSDVREIDLRVRGRYESIEIVDVRGNGPQRVLLDDTALRQLPQNHSGFAFDMARKLSVLGDAEDTLEFDLEGYSARGANGGRAVYGRDGVYYGLEISQGLRVQP